MGSCPSTLKIRSIVANNEDGDADNVIIVQNNYAESPTSEEMRNITDQMTRVIDIKATNDGVCDLVEQTQTQDRPRITNTNTLLAGGSPRFGMESEYDEDGDAVPQGIGNHSKGDDVGNRNGEEEGEEMYINDDSGIGHVEVEPSQALLPTMSMPTMPDVTPRRGLLCPQAAAILTVNVTNVEVDGRPGSRKPALSIPRGELEELDKDVCTDHGNGNGKNNKRVNDVHKPTNVDTSLIIDDEPIPKSVADQKAVGPEGVSISVLRADDLPSTPASLFKLHPHSIEATLLYTFDAMAIAKEVNRIYDSLLVNVYSITSSKFATSKSLLQSTSLNNQTKNRTRPTLRSGRMCFADGSVYEGEIQANLANGRGTLLYANKDKYIGDFVRGKRDGTGLYFFANGDSYTGQWVDDTQNGIGIERGGLTVYQGWFKRGRRNGRGCWRTILPSESNGTVTNTDGTHFPSNVLHSVTSFSPISLFDFNPVTLQSAMESSGVSQIPSHYVGEWCDDQMYFGLYRWGDGRQYTGNWSDGCMSGRGELVWPAASRIYRGEFVAGAMTGFGIMYYQTIALPSDSNSLSQTLSTDSKNPSSPRSPRNILRRNGSKDILINGVGKEEDDLEISGSKRGGRRLWRRSSKDRKDSHIPLHPPTKLKMSQIGPVETDLGGFEGAKPLKRSIYSNICLASPGSSGDYELRPKMKDGELFPDRVYGGSYYERYEGHWNDGLCHGEGVWWRGKHWRSGQWNKGHMVQWYMDRFAPNGEWFDAYWNVD